MGKSTEGYMMCDHLRRRALGPSGKDPVEVAAIQRRITPACQNSRTVQRGKQENAPFNAPLLARLPQFLRQLQQGDQPFVFIAMCPRCQKRG